LGWYASFDPSAAPLADPNQKDRHKRDQMKEPPPHIEKSGSRAVKALRELEPSIENAKGAQMEVEAQNKRRQLVERMRNLSAPDASAIETSWK
jgi:hypothetical protein